MLNLFKKANKGSQQNGQNVGGMNTGFEPPKNLPDLAKDIYEHEQSQPGASNNASNKSSDSTPDIVLPSKPIEPRTESVPRLDLSLIRQRMASQQIPQTLSREYFEANSAPSAPEKAQPVPQALPASSLVASSVLSSAEKPSDHKVQTPPMTMLSNMDTTRTDRKEEDLYNGRGFRDDSRYAVYNAPYGSVPQYRYDVGYEPAMSHDPYAQNNYLRNYPDYTFVPASSGPVPGASSGQSLNFENPAYGPAYIPNYGPNNNSNYINGSKYIIDDGSGFFREFEEYLRKNGLDNEIVNDLLGKDLLEHMMFYHTSKTDGVPFYASSAELSRMIKLRFDDLENMERSWNITKQKTDLLKKISASLESDIHLKSEELKKLILDTKQRGKTPKSDSFFQILKPKAADEPRSEHSADAPPEVAMVSTQSPDIVQQHVPEHSEYSEKGKYLFNKYIIHDSSKFFYSRDGQVFRSLADLMSGLEVMDDNTFRFHVNQNKNDFANWIKGVFGDYRLSDAIRPLTDQEKLWYYIKDNTS